MGGGMSSFVTHHSDTSSSSTPPNTICWCSKPKQILFDRYVQIPYPLTFLCCASVG
eukprot:NODE_7091_length_245_cov_25.372449_g7008_i0.p3 GENE.NODE_7091_length_245_cov_25.372449_g7008_i0~~NODE_7091_length_245_cov_25.372449_g7008_i0.p3  ORF type:complete len:56 (-),score=7.27 NODE_7091_length_245_cov_25.372449_g7008_i0:47-214(-)